MTPMSTISKISNGMLSPWCGGQGGTYDPLAEVWLLPSVQLISSIRGLFKCVCFRMHSLGVDSLEHLAARIVALS